MYRNRNSVLTMIGLAVLAADTGHSAVGRAVFVPMTFHAESQALRTSACLQIKERVYPETTSWAGFAVPADVPEKAFENTIDAVRRKDKASFIRLSDPGSRKDMSEFDRQVGAFFEQLATIQLVAVPRAYEFDDLVVFFAKLRSGKQTFFTPFVFVLEPDGSVGFLPSRTRQLAYQLVTDWFDAPWGPSASDNPAYCSDQEVRRATHRIPVMPALNYSRSSGQPSYLFLKGAGVAKPGPLSSLATEARLAERDIKEAVAGRRIEALAAHLTPDGAVRLKEWFATATEQEKDRHRKAMADQQAFYLFDAAPLAILYTRSPDKVVQVLYFIPSAKKELLWANSSHVTVADGVFKRGAMYEAASLEEPFKTLEIR